MIVQSNYNITYRAICFVNKWTKKHVKTWLIKNRFDYWMWRLFQWYFRIENLFNRTKFRFCIKIEFKSINNHHIQEFRDLLRRRGVWVQKNKTINIVKALVNALQNWIKWSKNESFNSLAIFSSATFSSNVQPLPKTSTEQIAKAATRQTLEQSLGRAYSQVLEWVLDQPLEQSFEQSFNQPLDRPQQLVPTAELIDQSNGSDQTLYSMKNGSAIILYKLTDTETFHVFDALVTLVVFVQQHQSIKSVSKTLKLLILKASVSSNQISYQNCWKV